MQKSQIEIELDLYANTGAAVDGYRDAREVWINDFLKVRYPALSTTAQDMLCIPASSAPVGRVFSTAGIACSGRSSRFSGLSLEVKVLLQRNRTYLDYDE